MPKQDRRTGMDDAMREWRQAAAEWKRAATAYDEAHDRAAGKPPQDTQGDDVLRSIEELFNLKGKK